MPDDTPPTLSAHTTRFHVADRARWNRFTTEVDGDPTDAALLPQYVDWLTSQNYSPATVSRYLYGAQAALHAAGVQPSREIRRAARAKWTTYTNTYNQGAVSD